MKQPINPYTKNLAVYVSIITVPIVVFTGIALFLQRIISGHGL